MAEHDLLAVAEVARRLSYTVQHTRLLIRRGELAATKIGRDWLIEPQAVNDFLARRAERPKASRTHGRHSTNAQRA